MKRSAGILMHISSLPSPFGIGTLGKAAFNFVDFLADAGQTYWQILPINPTGYGDSPYQSFSVHAGNPYFIDLLELCSHGLIDKKKCQKVDWGANYNEVDYLKIYNNRFEILKEAFINFSKKENLQFQNFIKKNNFWLKDYSLYMAVKSYFNMLPWYEWPDIDIKNRSKSAIKYYSESLAFEINFQKFLQFLFYQQWQKLKNYANSKNIKIIGDIPIYVGLDSVETWAYPEIFWLDRKKNPVKVAGCPPDEFSVEGQLWGNPLYNWKVLKQHGYNWWIARMKTASTFFDVTRIDHFRGFDSYYAINSFEKNAINGEWIPGPGIDLFKKIRRKLGNIEVIAEDLGFLTPNVKKLLNDTGFPGMKILQFAFDSKNENEYLPHNYTFNSVVYTGTHDNNTTMGWFENSSEEHTAFAKKYGNFTEEEGYNWGFIRLCYSSVSKIAIIPMQDFLGLGSSARMNVPSTLGGNWTWRAKNSDFSKDLAYKIKQFATLYGRI